MLGKSAPFYCQVPATESMPRSLPEAQLGRCETHWMLLHSEPNGTRVLLPLLFNRVETCAAGTRSGVASSAANIEKACQT